MVKLIALFPFIITILTCFMLFCVQNTVGRNPFLSNNTSKKATVATKPKATTPIVAEYANTSEILQLGEGDAIVIVDLWSATYCEDLRNKMKNLARRINHFVTTSRKNNVQIIHALSKSSSFQRYTSKEIFWKNNDRGKYLQTRAKRLIKRLRSPAFTHLIPRKKAWRGDGKFCSGEYDGKDRNELGIVNEELSIDYEKDIVLDVGNFFPRIRNKGIRRLFYVGQSLNLCVLSTRTFSALPAVLSKEFDHVGIVLNLTRTLIRYHPNRDVACKSLSDEECVKLVYDWLYGKKDVLGIGMYGAK